MFDHFIVAQEGVYQDVLAELRAGRKVSHWMWFIFPQLAALGRSPTAKRFGLAGSGEARSYLAHPLLGPRLVACTRLANAIENRTAHDIFGSPDDLKFCSSMTLFAHVAPQAPEFRAALDKYFAGKQDPLTLAELQAGPG
ncbi:MAG TPA: DUF1810 domain-containing protein [Devosiaceae bacterium]